MSTIQFPTANKSTENTIQSEIAQQNVIYLQGIRERMMLEYAALARTDDYQAVTLGGLISDIINSVIDKVSATLNDNPELNNNVHAPYFINQCMHSINAIFAGGVLSPLTGDDAEWRDITVPEDVGKEFKIEYRGNEYAITIESVQINVRYPKIYRLNNDNRYAHRIDYVQFRDVSNNHVNLTQDSIRFIQFPYTMQSLQYACIIENNTIVDYLDLDHDSIADGLVYHDQTPDPHAYVVAPKIPFYMLEDAGIDIIAEVKEFDYMVDALHDADDNDFDDISDDDIDD